MHCILRRIILADGSIRRAEIYSKLLEKGVKSTGNGTIFSKDKFLEYLTTRTDLTRWQQWSVLFLSVLGADVSAHHAFLYPLG